MSLALRKLATEVGWRIPLHPPVPRGPVVLMYHGVPRTADACGFDAAAFERQIRFLKDHFDLVSFEEVRSAQEARSAGQTRRTSRSRRIQVMLTFDDGFRNNAEIVAPVLIRYGVPAVFFVSTRHLNGRCLLWFAYLRALREKFKGASFRFSGDRMDMSPARRAVTVDLLRRHFARLKPYPAKVYEVIDSELPRVHDFVDEADRRDLYEGMTREQVRWLSSHRIFTIGAHTVDHPLLTLCDTAQQASQIRMSKAEIENLTGHPCETFAYPAADYNREIVNICSGSGFHAAFSVHKQIIPGSRFEVTRVGVYYPPVTELGFKIRWSRVLRQVQQWRTISKQ